MTKTFSESMLNAVTRFLLALSSICFISALYFTEFNFKISSFTYRIFPSKTTVVKSSVTAASLPLNGTLFCWVMTSPKYFDSRVPAINSTWLRRCNHGEFFTTQEIQDVSIPHTTVFSSLDDSYEQLFYKTINGFYYAYRNISKDFDWFLKADDDTYFIIENLKEYLSKFDSKKPYYIGYTFNTHLPNGYQSGGAGYVLSNEAVRIFVEELYDNRTKCPFDVNEDVGMGRCLQNVGIYPTNTRNEHGQTRFSPYSIVHMHEEQEHCLPTPGSTGCKGFAEDAISFHYQSPLELKMLDLSFYNVKVPSSESAPKDEN